jgi:hypothetical protein
MALNGFLGWFHGLIMTDISDGSLVDFYKYLGWVKGLVRIATSDGSLVDFYKDLGWFIMS